MKKYRVKAGMFYWEIQKRVWLFFWEDCNYEVSNQRDADRLVNELNG